MNDGLWIDGEWLNWDDFGETENHSHLAKLEHEAELRLRYPNADIALIPYFASLLNIAQA